MKPFFPRIVIALSLLALTGCEIERFFPEKVANGAARLSVQTAGVLIREIYNDSKCGFKSEASKKTLIIKKDPEHPDRVIATWKVKDCEMDYGNKVRALDGVSCDGVATTVIGKYSVSATLTQKGFKPEQTNRNFPLIPNGPDSVSIQIDKAEFDNFRVGSTGRDEAMTIINGSMSFQSFIHLAKDQLGLCTIPVPNISIQNLRLTDALVRMPGFIGNFEAPIASSNISAQAGYFENKENILAGEIQVWDETFQVPSDDDGLMPDYNREEWEEGFTCKKKNPNLLDPIEFCKEQDFEMFLGTQMARLLVLNAASLVKEIVGRKPGKCSLISEAAITGAASGGHKTLRNGQFILTTMVEKCEVSNPVSRQLSRGCLGNKTMISGNATVTARAIASGKKTLPPVEYFKKVYTWYKGIFIVAPHTPQSATIIIDDATLDNFSSYSLSPKGFSRAKLKIVKGKFSGELSPVLGALKGDTCNFRVPTAIAFFRDLNFEDATLVLTLNHNGQDLIFKREVESTSINALNGEWNGESNWISGSLTFRVDEEKSKGLTLPKNLALNPSFDPELFHESYKCSMEKPETDQSALYRAFDDPDYDWETQCNIKDSDEKD